MLIAASYFFVDADNNIEMFKVVSVFAQIIGFMDIVFVRTNLFMKGSFQNLLNQLNEDTLLHVYPFQLQKGQGFEIQMAF